MCCNNQKCATNLKQMNENSWNGNCIHINGIVHYIKKLVVIVSNHFMKMNNQFSAWPVLHIVNCSNEHDSSMHGNSVMDFNCNHKNTREYLQL